MKKLEKTQSYGTVPSDGSQMSHASQRRQDPEEQADVNSVRGHKGHGPVFLCMCLILMWLFGLSGHHETAAAKPSLPLASDQNEQDPDYIWLIEHDEDAHDPGLATLKSLYAVDIFLTNKTEGCKSIIETSSWNLDRACYADMFLDDVFFNPDKYNKLLGADKIFCDRAGYDSTPSSQSRECRIFGNSYFSLSGFQQRWPPIDTLDVSPQYNLAYRPSFDGPHRAEPCICQGNEAGIPSFTAKASKYSRLLVVDCLNWIPTGSTTMSQGPDVTSLIRKPRRADDMFPALAPGFYMVPADLSEPHAVNMQHSIGSKGQGVNFSHQFLVTRAVSVASEKSSYSKNREMFPLERSTLPTTNLHDNALPTNQYMVYVATGILILFIGLAVTGHAIKRKLQYRAKLKSEQPAPPPDQQNLAPGQVNDYVILKEPKDTLDPHPWYQRLGQSGQVIFPVSEWKKRFFKSPPENERILPNLDEAEKGNSPRKLQKRRGTKPEDRPDLPVRIMPPASAMPWPSLDSGPSESAVLGNHDTNRKAQNFTGGAVEGLSTAQQTVSSKIAATRRSNRSTSA